MPPAEMMKEMIQSRMSASSMAPPEEMASQLKARTASSQLTFRMKETAQAPGVSSRRPPIRSSAVTTVERGSRGGGVSGTDMAYASSLVGPRQARADPVDATVTIEQVVSIERDDLAIRGHEMNTGALDPAEAEIEPIHELDDRDPEHVLVGEACRHFRLGQAAQEFGQPRRRVVGAGGEGEQLDELLLQNGLLLEADGVGRDRDELLARHQ